MMDGVAELTTKERSDLFELTSNKINLPATAVEKDFWVCWVLKKIFGTEELSSQLLFKGGTSLSKCYGLIERFSEDIDLILDWERLTDEDPYAERSNTRQDRFNKNMEVLAQDYIRNELLPSLTSVVTPLCETSIHSVRAKSIVITYPRAFPSSYIKPEIELEIGPMSAMVPNQDVTIRSFCSDVAPKLFNDPYVLVRAIEAKKTFWDKVTILHVEAHRPEDKQQQARYSRHYYDLYQMINSPVCEEALADINLLKNTVAFKAKFYPQGWANYQAARDGNFSLVPPVHISKTLERDYEQMKEMIFGNYPTYNEIMETIAEFEIRLREAFQSG